MDSDKSVKRIKDCAKISSPESFGLGVLRLERLSEDSRVLGNITVQTAKAKGTTFTVTLPFEIKQKLEVKEIG